MYNQGILQYQKTNIESTSPERLIVLLYEGAVRHLKNARTALRDGDVVERLNGLRKAHAILSELRHSLDHELGGPVAANLDALYDYMLQEITWAAFGKDGPHIDNALRTIAPLYDAWRRIPAGSAQQAQRSVSGALPAETTVSPVPTRQDAEPAEHAELCLMV